MSICISVLFLVWLIALAHESITLRRARAKLSHVVHVNGTRGKSTLTRLIYAGLRGGDLAVFCKTTGTTPQTIDPQGNSAPVRRRGMPNLKEQIATVKQAVAHNATILVVECMALAPELQSVSAHKMLQADVGVITNVRYDHTDIMGDSLSEIASVLGLTIPKKGDLFTAEQAAAPLAVLQSSAKKAGTTCHVTTPRGDEGDLDFPENIALALDVCAHLGVPRDRALAGMHTYFVPDPFSLSVHTWGDGVFVNGLSINDSLSNQIVWEHLSSSHDLSNKDLVLLLNNRTDRGARTVDMVQSCVGLAPTEIWVMGANQGYVQKKLNHHLPTTPVRLWKNPQQLPTPTHNQVVFAIGNLAQGGHTLLQRIETEGSRLV